MHRLPFDDSEARIPDRDARPDTTSRPEGGVPPLRSFGVPDRKSAPAPKPPRQTKR